MDANTLENKKQAFLRHLHHTFGPKMDEGIDHAYVRLVEQVNDLVKAHPMEDMPRLRSRLFDASGLKEAVNELVLEKKLCGGLVLSYGTADYWEVLTCGNQQEIAVDSDGVLIQESVPMDKNSIFDLASVTKVITCLTVMGLYEKGLIDIKKPVGDFDRRFVNIQELTLEELLSFTPGLRTQRRIDQLDIQSAKEELFQVTYSREPQLRPYSDMGAMVIKYILEAALQKPFVQIVEEQVLSHVEQGHFFVNIPENLLHMAVHNDLERKVISGKYSCKEGPLPGAVHDPKAGILEPQRRNLCGHAGLFASAVGMAKLGVAVLKGEIVQQKTLENIGTNRVGYQAEDGRYSQYLGLLCHTKHPDPSSSEVYELLSHRAFAMGGYTGNHFMLDGANGIFSFFGSNRCHNRVTTVVNSPEVARNDDNCILWTDGNAYVDSTRFAWDRDAVLHKMQDYTIQLSYLQTLCYSDDKSTGVVVRKL